MTLNSEASLAPKGRSLRPVPMLIFGSRWLQLPLYIGLIVAQGIYVVLFVKELWHLFADSFDCSEQQIMLAVLGLIDVGHDLEPPGDGDRRRLRDLRLTPQPAGSSRR